MSSKIKYESLHNFSIISKRHYFYESDCTTLLNDLCDKVEASNNVERTSAYFVCNGEHDYVDQVEQLLSSGVGGASIVFDDSLDMESIFKLGRLKKEYKKQLSVFLSKKPIRYCSANIDDKIIFNSETPCYSEPSSTKAIFLNATKDNLLNYKKIYLNHVGNSVNLHTPENINLVASSVALNEKAL